MPWSDKVLLTALVHGGKAIQQHMHGRGVYELLLGNEIVYFGATCRGRFGDRIIKHCIKLIGWDVGGVAVAGKWREFLDGRQNDLADMSARTLSTTSPPLALGIEAYLIKEYRTRTKHLPLLNARCPKYKLPPNYIVDYPPEMPLAL